MVLRPKLRVPMKSERAEARVTSCGIDVQARNIEMLKRTIPFFLREINSTG